MRQNFKLYSILTLIILCVGVISKELLKTEDLLINSLSEQLTQKQIQNYLDFNNKWQWLGYMLLPLLLFIKIIIIAFVLDMGVFFFGGEIKYKKLFNIVVQAEYVFLLVIVLKFFWFYVLQQDYTLEEMQYFYPLSMINITGYEGIQVWFIYPLQVINLFELAYWFILAYLIGKEIKTTTEKGFLIVASSYGVGLLIWVIGVMFFTLNMN